MNIIDLTQFTYVLAVCSLVVAVASAVVSLLVYRRIMSATRTPAPVTVPGPPCEMCQATNAVARWEVTAPTSGAVTVDPKIKCCGDCLPDAVAEVENDDHVIGAAQLDPIGG